ncbi:retrovirus-related pol polyprotein from transposon TNT 1-94 [Tanacetum coccineum]
MSSMSSTGTKENATSSGGNNVARKARVVKCYNCQGEGHMTRQCTQPKRPRNAAWFKEKMLLAQAQESGQTDAIDVYDSYCDDIFSAKAILMANLSSYGSDNLSENELNKLAEDFGKHFVPQKELSAEQAFWLPLLNPISEQHVVQTTPVKTKAPSELPKVVKVKTTPDAITEGSWGFEHTKAVFKQEVIPFIKTLSDLLKDFDNGFHNELNGVKMVFNQMEAVTEQYVMNIMMHADSITVNVLPANNKCLVHDNLEIERLEQENEHLFELFLSQDIVHICVNSIATRNECCKMQQSFIHEYNENLVLKAELAKKEHMVEKKFFDEVILRCSRLENRCVNLELKLQLAVLHTRDPKDKPFTDMLVTGSDQKLYKFMEGNFPRLRLNDIKDMLLLVVQNKLFNLDGEVIVHLAATLCVLYLDKLERNKLMCTHELYKFSEGTLISVQDKLKDMANNLELGYVSVMLRMRWSNLDKKRSRIMVKDIDCQLLEIRLLRSLEKFIGGREYGEDLRLLQRTI